MDSKCCFKNKRQKSFTLVELLVVIAVIGLLSSIVLVSMKGTRDKAKIAKGLEFSQSVQHALGAYAVGWWSFETIEAGKVIDGSSYGNDGTVAGATVVAGLEQLGNALSFDGVDDYVSLPTANFVFGLNDGTICHWIKPSVIDSDRDMVVFRKDSPYQYFHTRITSTGKLFGGFRWVAGAGYKQVTGAISLPINIWSFVCAVADRNDKLKLFVNGAADNTGDISGGAAASMEVPDTVTIGKRVLASSPGYTAGLIDEVRIYTQALSVTEIQRHYTEGLERHKNLAIK